MVTILQLDSNPGLHVIELTLHKTLEALMEATCTYTHTVQCYMYMLEFCGTGLVGILNCIDF